jgi:PA26 p53-induced protein (sestrin)
MLFLLQAAASHNCAYLVNLQTAEFVAQQGDIRWLRGLDNVPEKIRQLAEISRILAHRPWLITPQHIKVRVSDSHLLKSTFVAGTAYVNIVVCFHGENFNLVIFYILYGCILIIKCMFNAPLS